MGHYTMIKMSVLPKYITILDVYAPSSTASKSGGQIDRRERDISTVKVGNFYISYQYC